MSGSTRKNQATRLVTLCHRSTMSGALVMVLPPFDGGFHCGNQVSSGVTASCSSVLPAPNARLHCGYADERPFMAGPLSSPAVQRRAPLR
jgi:hypothetical protein